MSDIFLTEDVQTILHNKFVVIIGDSIQRSVYKDLIQILQKNSYLTQSVLRKRGELSCNGDKLIEGGQMGEMTNKKSYREVREYKTDYHLVRFYFVTRCYNDYMESILSDLRQEPKADLVVMNSCLWDTTRYGVSQSVPEYKKNLIKMCARFNESLPEDVLLIWNTALPVSSQIKGGFLIPEIEFMSDTLRLDIIEANFYARQVVVDYGFDVLDMHYYFRRLMHHRVGDGVHWDMIAHRRMTNLLITHVCQAWGLKLPCRAKNLTNFKASRPTAHNANSAELHNSFHELINSKKTQSQSTPGQSSLLGTPSLSSLHTPENRYGGPIRRTVYVDGIQTNTPHGSSQMKYLHPSSQVQFNVTIGPWQDDFQSRTAGAPGHSRDQGRYQPYSSQRLEQERRKRVQQDWQNQMQHFGSRRGYY